MLCYAIAQITHKTTFEIERYTYIRSKQKLVGKLHSNPRSTPPLAKNVVYTHAMHGRIMVSFLVQRKDKTLDV